MEEKSNLKSTYLFGIYYGVLLLFIFGIMFMIDIDNFDLKEYFSFLAFTFSLSFLTQRYSESKMILHNKKLGKKYYELSKIFLITTLLLFISIVGKFLGINGFQYILFSTDLIFWSMIFSFSIGLIIFGHNFFVLLILIIKDLQLYKNFKLKLNKK